MLFRALVLMLVVGCVRATALGHPALPPQPKTRPAGMPASFMMLTTCIPGMGEHGADPHRSPHASVIYGTYRGTPVFSEIMLLPEDFAGGRSFIDVLKPLPGFRIDHTDIQFLPHGHEGMPFPHYDLHAFHVPHAASEKFCPAAVSSLKVQTTGRAKGRNPPGPVAQR